MVAEPEQYVDDCLFAVPPRGMTITWEDFIREALTSYRYGYAVFEKVWELFEGKWKYRKFASRHPLTLQQASEGPWMWDDHDGVRGIRQLGYVDGKQRTSEIGIANALLFSLDDEFGNPEGRSGFRPMYKPWFVKEGLLRILGVGTERQAVGIPYGTLPERVTDKADRERFEGILRNLFAHERAGFVLPFGYAVDTLAGALDSAGLLSGLYYCDNQISRSGLSQFINLGQSGEGSLALSREQVKFFLLALRSCGRKLASVINRYAIPQLVDYNFAGRLYPQVQLHDLGTTDEAAIMDALANLVDKGVVTADSSLENQVRDWLHLPLLTEEQEQAVGAQPAEGEPAEEMRERHGRPDHRFQRTAALLESSVGAGAAH